MNNDNGFELIIAVVFIIITQLGGLGPKAQYKLIQNSTSELFISEVNLTYSNIKQDKSRTLQANTRWNCQN